MDQLVRELLTSDGSTFKNPATNYYRISRDPESAVETTAQLFLGVRIQCAKVPQPPLRALDAGRLLRIRRVLLADRSQEGQSSRRKRWSTQPGRATSSQPRTGRKMKPKALGGPVLDDPATKDRRVRLATWLADAKNPFFAKSLVNRIWFHLIGRGIVEPVDDFRDSNPACNDELLEALTADFVKNWLRPQEADPVDPAQPHVSIERDHQSAECGRQPLFLPRPDQAFAGRSLARRDLDRHRPRRRPSTDFPAARVPPRSPTARWRTPS